MSKHELECGFSVRLTFLGLPTVPFTTRPPELLPPYLPTPRVANFGRNYKGGVMGLDIFNRKEIPTN